MLNLMFGGLCMALADSVPSVSGGTIFIVGLMIGSIYSIIMGPTTITGTYNYVPVNIYNFNVLFFILGGVLIGAIQYLKHLILKQSTDMNLKEID